MGLVLRTGGNICRGSQYFGMVRAGDRISDGRYARWIRWKENIQPLVRDFPVYKADYEEGMDAGGEGQKRGENLIHIT